MRLVLEKPSVSGKLRRRSSDRVSNSFPPHFAVACRSAINHKLRRAIANVHGQKFRGKNDREIELWNECGRLIANCMIYYNATLLNSLLTKLQKEKGSEKLIEVLKYISPVAWTHINLYGYYSFEEPKHAIDMTALVESLNLMKI